MLANLIVFEEQKLLKRWLTWILLIMAVGLACAMIVMPSLEIFINMQSNNGVIPEDMAWRVGSFTWPGGIENILDMGIEFGKIFLIILVGAVLTQEYTWRSLHLWLSRGISRPAIFVAKLVALMVALVLFLLLPLLLGGGLSGLATLQLQDHLTDTTPLDAGQIGLTLLRGAFVLLFYVALVILLSVSSRSAVVAIGGGLMFEGGINSIVFSLLGNFGGNWTKVLKFFPRGLEESILSLNQVTATPPEPSRMADLIFEPTTAALWLGGYILACLIASYIIFQRQDLP